MPDDLGLQLEHVFRDIFFECRGRGMPLPYLVALFGIDGSSFVYRLTADKNHETLQAKRLMSRAVGGGCENPIDGLIVDASGTALRFRTVRNGTVAIH
jgi:hypothetical protein